MLKLKCLFIVLSVFFMEDIFAGYGDWTIEYDGFPDMKDRRILVLTNSCRIDPTGYRDTYLGNYNILLPQNYPPVDPLYWQIDLNRVARIHSEDQALNGMSHSSSDGTSFGDRVKSYYTKSGWIAENIAAGSSEAISAVRQWLMDYTDYQTMTPAEDNTANDGHRRNIMNANYNEMGAGYAYGPAKYNHFWTQDFGGGNPSFNNPISSAAHFIENNSSLFMFTVKDPAGNKIQDATLVLEGENYGLNILFGDSSVGTFSQTLVPSDSCRTYYFRIIDSEGSIWRYPEEGKLITIGEGNCNEQYQYPEDIAINDKNAVIYSDFLIKSIKTVKNGIIIQFQNNFQNDFICTINTVSGKKVDYKSINKINNNEYFINMNNNAKGCYFFKLFNNNGLHSKFRYMIY